MTLFSLLDDNLSVCKWTFKNLSITSDVYSPGYTKGDIHLSLCQVLNLVFSYSSIGPFPIVS